MPNVLVSVRLSSELAEGLDRAVEHLECSPSGLVEALLGRGEARPEDIAQAIPQGPFTEKRNLRLAPDVVARLGQLGEGNLSGSVRRLLVYFFSNREWASLLGDRDNGNAQVPPRTASSSRRAPKIFTEQGHIVPQAHPIAPFVVLLALLVPFLILGIKSLAVWLRRCGFGNPMPPEDPEEPPALPSPP